MRVKRPKMRYLLSFSSALPSFGPSRSCPPSRPSFGPSRSCPPSRLSSLSSSPRSFSSPPLSSPSPSQSSL